MVDEPENRTEDMVIDETDEDDEYEEDANEEILDEDGENAQEPEQRNGKKRKLSEKMNTSYQFLVLYVK